MLVRTRQVYFGQVEQRVRGTAGPWNSGSVKGEQSKTLLLSSARFDISMLQRGCHYHRQLLSEQDLSPRASLRESRQTAF
jgi:hypothetical protein